jgi:hypothetical protein
VSRHDDDLGVRLGRIRDSGRSYSRPKSFVGQVMRAAKRAGHVGDGFGRGKGGASRSRFGRGRRAALSLSIRSTSQRVVMKARVVRHHGSRFRSEPLPKHITYLKREGVTRDGADARMFDAASDTTDESAFAERCKDDRHHFRFIISPDDAELGDQQISLQTNYPGLVAVFGTLPRDLEGVFMMPRLVGIGSFIY